MFKSTPSLDAKASTCGTACLWLHPRVVDIHFQIRFKKLIRYRSFFKSHISI